MESPHKGQWRGALICPLIYAWTNNWANNREAGDLRRHRAHYDVTIMLRAEGDVSDTMVPILAGIHILGLCPSESQACFRSKPFSESMVTVYGRICASPCLNVLIYTGAVWHKGLRKHSVWQIITIQNKRLKTKTILNICKDGDPFRWHRIIYIYIYIYI